MSSLDSINTIKNNGWDGIAIDWEVLGNDHDNDSFNEMFKKFKQHNLMTIFCVRGQGGPWKMYSEIFNTIQAKRKNYFKSISWKNIDYVVVELYSGGENGRSRDA